MFYYAIYHPNRSYTDKQVFLENWNFFKKIAMFRGSGDSGKLDDMKCNHMARIDERPL